MRRNLLVLLVFGTVSFLGIGTALGVDYPATTGTLNTSLTSVAPGDSVTVSGDGFLPGTPVQITIESTPTLLARVNADARGAIRATVTIPSGLEPGTHTLTATGANPSGGTLVLSRTITVTGGGGSGLPLTGTNTALLVGLALAVLVVGWLLIVLTQRHHASRNL